MADNPPPPACSFNHSSIIIPFPNIHPADIITYEHTETLSICAVVALQHLWFFTLVYSSHLHYSSLLSCIHIPNSIAYAFFQLKSTFFVCHLSLCLFYPSFYNRQPSINCCQMPSNRCERSPNLCQPTIIYCHIPFYHCKGTLFQCNLPLCCCKTPLNYRHLSSNLCKSSLFVCHDALFHCYLTSRHCKLSIFKCQTPLNRCQCPSNSCQSLPNRCS
jgi:hypothetical protein